MALLSMHKVSMGFGGPLLLEQVNLQIEGGERVCLLGRNGVGKSTLLKLINGDMSPDEGVIIRQQGLRIAFLPQEVPQGLRGTVFDVVVGGLGKHSRPVAEYHQMCGCSASEGENALSGSRDLIQETMDIMDIDEGSRQALQQVKKVISYMKLDPEAVFGNLSAGLKRRVLLARGLVIDPDILLLDEPTNHLDIKAIGWLEKFLPGYGGTLLFVTHDRMFMRKMATRIIELDRGKLSNWSCNYDNFLKRKQAALETEAAQRALFDKKLAQEEDWVRQGIKARRTRNEGRVQALVKMREERRTRRELTGMARMPGQEAERSGKLVIKAKGVSYRYDDRLIIRDFSTTIIRGDKVGIIGPNGSGKTTLLRVLLGELLPEKGGVHLGTNLKVAYFDQLRAQLDEEKSVMDNIAEGSDMISINGKQKHVIGYLQDFLFSPERARTPVSILSGGERNCLLLAKLFVKPSNVLVMDEPTNDLDVETLELLEGLLVDYPGTLLLVSHDRAFINNVVTSTLALEGEGRVGEYIGGYDDWLRQRKPDTPSKIKKTVTKTPKSDAQQQRPRKLSFKEKRELEALPQHIEALEAEQRQFYQTMAEPAFYKQDSGEIVRAQDRLKALEHELGVAYQRWENLEDL